ncbi:hypothetical protein UFOVP510_2 [uncultured Caudovirales phage]|uniref:Uncharacterized protein n=1 Tax=uncultured Caudovirales phage TaxID=2100421 RepID=A0A6J5MTI7_9CAUD|nr:hypothetical protein UFOVP510_2 [uncultured Caudovirales phage]
MNKPIKMAKRSQEALAKPGLKLLTPLEGKKIMIIGSRDGERWKHLFSLNKWRLIK